MPFIFMSGGWYEDMLADSSAKETTKTLTQPPALTPSSITKLDEHGMALSKKYQQYVQGTYVTDAAKTIVWYLLFLIGTIRLAIRRFKRRVEDADMAQEYEIAEVVACSDNNWAFVTLSFCNMLEKGGGSICTPGNELATLMNLDTVTSAKGTPISLAVTYDHHGRKHIVTYSLADLTPVRFPPIKPLAETVEETPSTKLAVLSASFGSWFSSEDNADVTDIVTHLLGPEKDFYAAANISQYICDLESDVDAPIKPPIVYKGRALLNLLATGDKKWPLSTDVACWWCCHKFACTPCPLPVAYKEEKGFLVKGCFCSFSCAKAYNFREGGAARDLHNHYLFLLTQRLWVEFGHRTATAVHRGDSPLCPRDPDAQS
eukprot:jgi/Mesvir1/18225/Mv09504-RA.1